MGLEHDLDVTNDSEYYEKIFQTGSYKATHEDMIDFYEDLSRLVVITHSFFLTLQGRCQRKG